TGANPTGNSPSTTAAPLIGHFKPEVGTLQALINSPNFVTRAKGTWSLRITDMRTNTTAGQNGGPGQAPTQYVQSWSLNFTGRIATTQGASYPGTSGTSGGTSGFGIDVPVFNFSTNFYLRA